MFKEKIEKMTKTTQDYKKYIEGNSNCFYVLLPQAVNSNDRFALLELCLCYLYRFTTLEETEIKNLSVPQSEKENLVFLISVHNNYF